MLIPSSSPQKHPHILNSTFWLEKSQRVRTFAALVGPDNQKSLVLVRGRVFVAVRLAEITVLEDAIGKSELDSFGFTLVVFLSDEQTGDAFHNGDMNRRALKWEATVPSYASEIRIARDVA